MSSESVDTNGDPVPDVVFEAFFNTPNSNMVHVRVSGGVSEFDYLLQRFQFLCKTYQHMSKGTSYVR